MITIEQKNMLNRFSLYQINNSMANLYIGLGGAGVKTLRELRNKKREGDYFQCLDLIHKNGFLNWEVEGLASYFAKDWTKQIPSSIDINDYNLKTDPSNYADSYWMGYHVFAVFEEKYANSGFKNMLTASFSKSLEIAIPEGSNESFGAFESEWRGHCDRLKGQISASKKQIQ